MPARRSKPTSKPPGRSPGRSPGAGRPVTLKSIAEHLSVSVTTVARSLAGGERIGAETVARVLAAADELGYVRNLDGVKLRTGRTYVLMAFLGFAAEEEIGDSSAMGLLHGIHDRCSGTPYSVRAVPTEIGRSSMPQIEEIVAGRNADGLILDHTSPQDERVRYLLEHDVPFVTFGRTELYTPHAWFDIDNEHAARQGTQAMLDAGRRRVCLLDGPPGYAFVQQRIRGYRAALDAAGIAFDPALVAHPALEPRAIRESAHRLVAEHGADAFVCVNELVMFGARAGVRQHGEATLAATSFSMRASANIGDYLGTSIASSSFSMVEAGRTLADLLLRRLDGEPVEALQRLVRTELRHHRGVGL